MLDEPVCLPYIDNLTVLRLQPTEAPVGLDAVAALFQRLGFELHAFTGVETASAILGLELGVESPGILRAKGDRVWKLRSALQWLGQQAWVSGDQVCVRPPGDVRGRVVGCTPSIGRPISWRECSR